jgi:hypothetical protein
MQATFGIPFACPAIIVTSSGPGVVFSRSGIYCLTESRKADAGVFGFTARWYSRMDWQGMVCSITLNLADVITVACND